MRIVRLDRLFVAAPESLTLAFSWVGVRFFCLLRANLPQPPTTAATLENPHSGDAHGRLARTRTMAVRSHTHTHAATNIRHSLPGTELLYMADDYTSHNPSLVAPFLTHEGLLGHTLGWFNTRCVSSTHLGCMHIVCSAHTTCVQLTQGALKQAVSRRLTKI